MLGLNGPSTVKDSIDPALVDEDDPLSLNPAKEPAPKRAGTARRIPGQHLDEGGMMAYDGPLRYLVKSRQRPDIEHLVQLDAYRFNGSCSCEHFSIPLLNKLRGGAVPSDDTRCFHIKHVRSHLLDWFIREVSRHRGDTSENDDDGLT